jgi:SAM-dependent methyltransferase
MIDGTFAGGNDELEATVRRRYSAAAGAREQSLCCPVDYRREYLNVIPPEILERDYGCGDPTPFVRPGETVLDLGSGGGKACYIASQIVGAEGKVIGVDCNQEMIALARRYREQVAAKIGYSNVEFRYGMIQDLALDLEQLAHDAAGWAITDPESWIALRSKRSMTTTTTSTIGAYARPSATKRFDCSNRSRTPSSSSLSSREIRSRWKRLRGSTAADPNSVIRERQRVRNTTPRRTRRGPVRKAVAAAERGVRDFFPPEPFG